MTLINRNEHVPAMTKAVSKMVRLIFIPKHAPITPIIMESAVVKIWNESFDIRIRAIPKQIPAFL